MKIIRPYKTFFLFLFILICLSCQKDWGNTEIQIYDPVNPPPESVRFDPELFDIEYTINPSLVKIGYDAVISVKIVRKNDQPIGCDLYYNWYILPKGIYYWYYSNFGFRYSLETLFRPNLEEKGMIQDFNRNSVIFKTDPYKPRIKWFNHDGLLEALDNVNPATIKLKIGYKNENEEIRYFYSNTIEIFLQL